MPPIAAAGDPENRAIAPPGRCVGRVPRTRVGRIRQPSTTTHPMKAASTQSPPTLIAVQAAAGVAIELVAARGRAPQQPERGHRQQWHESVDERVRLRDPSRRSRAAGRAATRSRPVPRSARAAAGCRRCAPRAGPPTPTQGEPGRLPEPHREDTLQKQERSGDRGEAHRAGVMPGVYRRPDDRDQRAAAGRPRTAAEYTPSSRPGCGYPRNARGAKASRRTNIAGSSKGGQTQDRPADDQDAPLVEIVLGGQSPRGDQDHGDHADGREQRETSARTPGRVDRGTRSRERGSSVGEAPQPLHPLHCRLAAGEFHEPVLQRRAVEHLGRCAPEPGRALGR